MTIFLLRCMSPLLVQSRHDGCTANVRLRGLSGHDRRRESVFVVAIGGKADMMFCSANVRF